MPSATPPARLIGRLLTLLLLLTAASPAWAVRVWDTPVHAGDDIEVTGPITALGASSLTVQGQTFAVTPQTRIRDANHNTIPFSALTVGLVVEVEGFVGSGGALVAEKIDVEDHEGELEAEGLVTARTDSSLTVGGLTFGVTAATRIRAATPMTFASVVVGLRVEVEGYRAAGGALVATEIEIGHHGGDDDGELEVHGRILRVTADSLVVGGYAFALTPATVVVDDNDRPVSADTLVAGLRVEVEGRYLATGTLVALRVEIEDVDEGELEVTGPIEALSATGLTVAATDFTVTPQTVVLDDARRPIPFDSLALGQTVEVRGIAGPGGTRVATHIKVEDRGAPEQEIEVRAALDAVSDSVAVVLGRPFAVVAATRIVGAGGTTVALASLPLGQPVEVSARREADGRLTALRIAREDGPVTAVRLRARVSAVSSDSLSVLSVPFAASTAAVVRTDGTAGTLADVAVGQDVLVTGVRAAAGGFTATRIEILRAAQALGRVASVGTGGFALPGVAVTTTPATLVVTEAGVPVAAIAPGAAVRAFGTTTGLGTLAATRVVVLDASAATAGTAAPAPAALVLDRVFPNPTVQTATVRYTLAAVARVTVTLVDVRGRTVLALADGTDAAGTHEVRLDASRLPAGVYAVRLSVDGRPAGTQMLTVAR